jgi:hypothetical protein
VEEIHVKNAQEAFKLIISLKHEGKHNIFRGQKECWSLNSTLFRKKETERIVADNRLNNFTNWVSSNSDLLELQQDTDKLLSVAQHYGFPTNFIDFTYDPEIAFFFATGEAGLSLSEGCIYCANESELNSTIQYLDTTINENLRIVKLEVDNLWRLQSQKGLFLDDSKFLNNGWENLFPFVKIIFPHDLFRSSIAIEQIYPIRKSRLEIKLDQYIREEQVQLGLNKAERFGVQIFRMPWESNYTIFREIESLHTDPQWNILENSWGKINAELYSDAVSDRVFKLDVNGIYQPLEIKQLFYERLLDFIQVDLIKGEAFKFDIRFTANEIEWSVQMNGLLELYWDGVRYFPYTNEEICEGLSNLVAMLYNSKIGSEKYISDIFNETHSFDCLIANGGSFRVTLPLAPFLNAIDLALLEEIDKQLFPDIKEPLDLFDYLYDIKLLFKFEDFKRLLITYIIPCQIISNSDPTGYYSGGDDEHVLVVYSPFEILGIRSATSFLGKLKRYRHEEKVVAIHENLSDDELILLMAYSLEKIKAGGSPITITISGVEDDPREIQHIPRAITLCNRLLKLGFISIQEVSTFFKEIPEAYDPYALGSFEIWRIAIGKMENLPMEDIESLFKKFMSELPEFNNLCDELVSNVENIDEEVIEGIKTKGIYGSDIFK